MRRWALARALRTRSRDWSPLPITSNNSALIDNAGLNAAEHFFGQPDRETLAARVRGKDQPTLRWRMREVEVSSAAFKPSYLKRSLTSRRSTGILVAQLPTRH